MKPAFSTLRSNYYSSSELQTNYVSGEKLYAEIGIDHATLIKQNPAYVNTCAARVSLALLKSGVSFSGRLAAKSGTHKGQKLETGAKLLADQLKRSDVFGMPEIYNSTTFPTKVKGRKGVVFFWKMSDYQGGHIDLIDSSSEYIVCSSACYFQAQEIWFWPLK